MFSVFCCSFSGFNCLAVCFSLHEIAFCFCLCFPHLLTTVLLSQILKTAGYVFVYPSSCVCVCVFRTVFASSLCFCLRLSLNLCVCIPHSRIPFPPTQTTSLTFNSSPSFIHSFHTTSIHLKSFKTSSTISPLHSLHSSIPSPSLLLYTPHLPIKLSLTFDSAFHACTPHFHPHLTRPHLPFLPSITFPSPFQYSAAPLTYPFFPSPLI